jgi:magnesium-transporting ATPase (P-type)
MIQRIQSLYLLVVSVACVLLFFFPMIDYIDPMKGTYKLFATGMKSYSDMPGILFFWQTFPLLFLTIASFILAIIAIFLYKNRTLQLQLVSINVLVNVLLIALVFLLYSRIFERRLGILSIYQFGMYVPLISLIFLVLASRAIRKDEAIVKSSDRLR